MFFSIIFRALSDISLEYTILIFLKTFIKGISLEYLIALSPLAERASKTIPPFGIKSKIFKLLYSYNYFR